jgi:signal recognition particle receptor subunit beta
MLINGSQLVLRIAYAGAPLSGKTETMKALLASLRSQSAGEALFSPLAARGRTIYFDWAQYQGGSFRDGQLHCQITSVPGQATLHRRRRLLIEDADVVVFVVDSQRDQLEANQRSLAELQPWLARRDLPPISVVYQANKRDLADALAMEEIRTGLALGDGAEIHESSAILGEGVRVCFVAAIRACVRRAEMLQAENRLPEGAPEIMTGDQLLQRVRLAAGADADSEPDAHAPQETLQPLQDLQPLQIPVADQEAAPATRAARPAVMPMSAWLAAEAQGAAAAAALPPAPQAADASGAAPPVDGAARPIAPVTAVSAPTAAVEAAGGPAPAAPPPAPRSSSKASGPAIVERPARASKATAPIPVPAPPPAAPGSAAPAATTQAPAAPQVSAAAAARAATAAPGAPAVRATHASPGTASPSTSASPASPASPATPATPPSPPNTAAVSAARGASRPPAAPPDELPQPWLPGREATLVEAWPVAIWRDVRLAAKPTAEPPAVVGKTLQGRIGGGWQVRAWGVLEHADAARAEFSRLVTWLMRLGDVVSNRRCVVLSRAARGWCVWQVVRQELTFDLLIRQSLEQDLLSKYAVQVLARVATDFVIASQEFAMRGVELPIHFRTLAHENRSTVYSAFLPPAPVPAANGDVLVELANELRAIIPAELLSSFNVTEALRELEFLREARPQLVPTVEVLQSLLIGE